MDTMGITSMVDMGIMDITVNSEEVFVLKYQNLFVYSNFLKIKLFNILSVNFSEFGVILGDFIFNSSKANFILLQRNLFRITVIPVFF